MRQKQLSALLFAALFLTLTACSTIPNATSSPSPSASDAASQAPGQTQKPNGTASPSASLSAPPDGTTGSAPPASPSGPSYDIPEQEEYHDWLKGITSVDQDVSEDVAKASLLKFSSALASNSAVLTSEMDGFLGAKARYYKAELYHTEKKVLTLKLLIHGESGAKDSFDSLYIDNTGTVKKGDSGQV